MTLALREVSVAAVDGREGCLTRPEFVLLDLYDTLVGFDRSLIRAARAAFVSELGPGLSVDDLERAERDTMPMRMVGGYGPDLPTALAEMLRAVGSSVESAGVDRFVEFELATWEKAAIVYPDVRPALERLLANDVRLGLVSNCCYLTPPLLDAWDLRRYFDAITLSCEVRHMKPGPRILRLALEAIGGRPEDGVLVDDNPRNVDAAREEGLVGYRIDRGEPATGPAVIGDLMQLADELLALTRSR